MLVFSLILNIVAAITCGVAAGMNFSCDNTVLGVSMTALCIVNIVIFAVNVGRFL